MGNKWSKRPWRRQYTTPSNEWMQLPMYLRGFAQLLVNLADDHGTIRCRGDVIDSVCRLLAVHPHERRMVRKHIPMLLEDGYIRLVPHQGEDDDGHDLEIRNFYEAQIAVRKGPKPRPAPNENSGEDSRVHHVDPKDGASPRNTKGRKGKKRELQRPDSDQPHVDPKDGASPRNNEGSEERKRKEEEPVDDKGPSDAKNGATIRNSVMTQGNSQNSTHRVDAPDLHAVCAKSGASARILEGGMAREEKSIKNKPLTGLGRQPALAGVDLGQDPDSKPDPYQQVIDAWFEVFEDNVGSRPVFQAKDGKAVKSLLRSFGGDVEAIVQVMHNAFENRFFAQEKADLTYLASNPNPYIRASARPARQPSRPGGAVPLFDQDSFGGDR